MKNSAFLKEASLFSPSDGLLKVTALLYLKDALLKEEYESCEDLVTSAREYGAQEGEIKEILAAAAKGKLGEPKGASRFVKLK